MGLVVLPALIPDIPKIYDIYFAAFENETMAQLMLKILFPGGITDEFRKAHTASTLSWWNHSTSQYTMKCVDTETDEIVGMLLADVHLRERSVEERKSPGVAWLEGAEKERAEKIINPLWEVKNKLFAGRPYIYCHVIAVAPKHQKRRAGAALMSWGLSMGDSLRLPIYMESSPTTIGMYERGGFTRITSERVVHKAKVLGSEKDIEVPLMVKMPACAGVGFEEWKEGGFGEWRKVEVGNTAEMEEVGKGEAKGVRTVATARWSGRWITRLYGSLLGHS